jgi:hypothetical protein
MWPFTGGAFSLYRECYGRHAYIPDQVIITVDDEMGPYSRVYAVGHACLSVCQVMSIPTFGTAVLAMLIQKVEVPKGGG